MSMDVPGMILHRIALLNDNLLWNIFQDILVIQLIDLSEGQTNDISDIIPESLQNYYVS